MMREVTTAGGVHAINGADGAELLPRAAADRETLGRLCGREVAE